MSAFFNVFREHRTLYWTLLIIGTIPAVFGVFVPLVIALLLVGSSVTASLLQGKRTPRNAGEKPLERLRRKQLIAKLQDAAYKQTEDAREIARLREQVQSISQIDADNELTHEVLQLVAALLTTYDKFRGEVSAEDTLEHLRGALTALGKEFEAEQTEHFTAQD